MSNLLKEIVDEWKLDAKHENSEKYFFPITNLDKIIRGEINYIIGRKGAGKTSICEHIIGISEPKVFSEKLSFKHFPFANLYELSNNNFTAPNQYITIWKYVVLSFVCRMFLRNENINSDLRKLLRKIYDIDPIDSLPRIISKWTKTGFGVSILGTGANFDYERNPDLTNDISIQERCEILEDTVHRYIDDSNYYIIFDELDEDYKIGIDNSHLETYFHLITGLFKAVNDIKSIFKKNIIPLIFLRDDIYRMIKDNDKTKWEDNLLFLEWNKKKIQDLLAHRISKMVNVNGNILPFEAAWNNVNNDGKVEFRRKTYEKIKKLTLDRPRDYIKLLKLISEDALKLNKSKMSPRNVNNIESVYSNYLRSEMIDEIHSVFPEIDKIFDVISQLRKHTFTFKEFSNKIKEARNNKLIKETNPSQLLKLLFQFSVIGNKSTFTTYFKYINEASINFSESFTIHRGLYKSFQFN
jgi:hypothetical protein